MALNLTQRKWQSTAVMHRAVILPSGAATLTRRAASGADRCSPEGHATIEEAALLRDGLTALAGLLIAALVAALALPPLLDWGWLKPRLEAQIIAATGLPARIEGDVSIRLLPRLELLAVGLAIGGAEQGPDVSDVSARVGRIALSVPISALLRGEARIARLMLDDVALTLRPDAQLSLGLPRLVVPRGFALEEGAITRGLLTLRGASGAMQEPFALAMSAQAAAGPWRVEGEVAGQPLRLVTGEATASGDVPMRLTSENEARRIEIDGTFGADATGGRLGLRWQGEARLAAKGASPLPAGPSQTPLLALSVRGRLADAGLAMSSVAVDLAEAGRLEGEGRWRMSGHAAELRLGARRLVADGLPALAAALGGVPGRAVLPFALPALEAQLAVEQLLWRGEELADLSATLSLDPAGAAMGRAQARFAGMSLRVDEARRAASGDMSGRVAMRAEAMQRPALALARLGLAPEAADALAALGTLEAGATARISADGSAWQIRNGVIATAAGEVRGEGGLSPAGAALTARLAGVDLATWPKFAPLWRALPAGQATGRVFDLDLAGERIRFGSGAAGRFTFRGQVEQGRWRIDALEADGFGGLALSRDAGRVRLFAADAAPVLSILELGLAREPAAWLSAHAARLSPLDLSLEVAPVGDAAHWQAEGRLGPGLQARLGGDLAAAVPRLAEARIEGGGAQLLGLVSSGGLALAQLRDALLPERAALVLRLAPNGAATLSLDGDGLALGWQAGRTADGILEGPLAVTLAGPQPVRLAARLAARAEGPLLTALSGDVAGRPLMGELASRGGVWTGRLRLAALTPAELALLAHGAAHGDGAGWSARRFAAVPTLPRLDVRLEAERVPLGAALEAREMRARLLAQDGALRLEEMAGELAGGQLMGALRLGHDGTLRSLGGSLALTGADAAALTDGALTGRIDLRLDGGGAGETPQRLVNSLSGTGEARLAGGAVRRLAPGALARLVSEGEAMAEMPAAIDGRAATLLADGDWPLDGSAAMTVTGGVLRLAPVSARQGDSEARFSAQFDLRRWVAEAQATLTLDGVARPGEPVPQASVRWRGQPAQMHRETEIVALRNLIAARALRRELDRIEVFEADARERAFHARRLRQERETRAREEQARQEQARQEQARQERSAAQPPPLPPPMVITPVPLPAPAQRAP